MDKIWRKYGGNNISPLILKELEFCDSHPFTPSVMMAPLPKDFEMPMIKEYDGTGDPFDHVFYYKGLIMINPAYAEVICRIFASSLTGPARAWFNSLLPNTITNFKELTAAFVSRFAYNIRVMKEQGYISLISQVRDERLNHFIERFINTLREVEYNEAICLTSLIMGLSADSPLKMSFTINPPSSMLEAIQRIHRYLN